MSIGAFSICVVGPFLRNEDSESLSQDLASYHQEDVLGIYWVEATVSSSTQSYAFRPSIVPFIASLLEAIQSIGRRDAFKLALVDDGEWGISGDPLDVEGGKWQLALWPLTDANAIEIQSTDRLLLGLLSLYSNLSVVCQANSIPLGAVLARCPAYVSLQ